MSSAGVAPEGAQPTAQRDLSGVPLTPPAATSGLLEVFRRRYLLKLLVRREISARYDNSVLGLAWSYLMPLTRFCMYYFLFQVMIGRGGSMENFAVHLFAGMVIVNYFTETFNSGTRSIMGNKALVRKMSLPREMFPVAAMLVSLYHTLPQLGLLIVVGLLQGWTPDPVGMLAVALGFSLVAVLGTGLGLLFSALNVYFRDFGKLVQVLTMFTNFMVPMMYPYTLVKERFGEGIGHTLYLLNPLAEAVLLMQRGFWVGTTSDPDATIAEHLPGDLFLRGGLMLLAALVFLGVAQWAFSRLEAKIPERI